MDTPRWLTPNELAAWRNLVGLTLFLPTRLEEPLHRNGLTFFDYSAMAVLSDAPDHTMPMSYLAHLSNGSPSRLSHAARRMEKRGWMRRHTSPDDGRVTLATLTDEGYAKLVEVAPVHVESVRQAVFDVLSAAQVAQMSEICAAIVEHIHPEGPPWEKSAQTAKTDADVSHQRPRR